MNHILEQILASAWLPKNSKPILVHLQSPACLSPWLKVRWLNNILENKSADLLLLAGSDNGANGNLIGASGLGFYSSLLVADLVSVAFRPSELT
jgi:hypothetical protein